MKTHSYNGGLYRQLSVVRLPRAAAGLARLRQSITQRAFTAHLTTTTELDNIGSLGSIARLEGS
jgi:hypothetical protein